MIKKKAINDLKLPFKLIFGKIGKLSLSIPWKQNFSIPTLINIDTIQIVLQMIKREDWEAIDYNSFENKIYYLLKFSKDKIYQLSQALANANSNNNANKKTGYLEKVFIKVLDNLHLNFKNINIRIEDCSNKIQKYSFGVTLQEILIVNTNDKWEEKFIDRSEDNKDIQIFKLLKIVNFGIYLKTSEDYFISQFEVGHIGNKMNEFFGLNEEKAKNIEYLIQPISLTVKMKQNNNKGKDFDVTIPKTHLLISLDKFDFYIQKNQYDCLIRIINGISDYSKFQYDFNSTIKYKFFRPKYKLNLITKEEEPLIEINELSSINSNKKKIAVLWWKYAIRMVNQQIKYSKGDIHAFDIPKDILNKYQSDFTIMFKKYYKDQKSLNEEELIRFKTILELTDFKDIFIWSKPVLQDIYTEQKKEEKKNMKQGYFSYLLGSSISNKDLITKEEEEKIEEILSNAVKEVTTLIINNEIETKFKLDFILKDGSFTFSKYINSKNAKITEGFGFLYKNLSFTIKKGEYFTELFTTLKYFQVDMFTNINNNIINIPITFTKFDNQVKISNPEVNIKETDNILEISTNVLDNITPSNNQSSETKREIETSNEHEFFVKINFRKNNPNEKINSKFSLEVNVLHFTYHQIFLERVITFFKVTLDEDLANIAWEKINTLKENTQQTLKENLYKKNIIEMRIAPRKIIIPINKYDIKNTKVLLIELGRMEMLNDDNVNDATRGLYKERYSLQILSFSTLYYPSFKQMFQNESPFQLIYDLKGNLSFCFLKEDYSNQEHPAFMLYLEIDNITIDLNCYLYSLLVYIIEILKPTKEVDLWSQTNSSKEEIKKNAKALCKLQKKNNTYLNYEDFFAVLSSGYIYFYTSSTDEEYVGYYYIKDAIIDKTNEDELIMKLTNIYGKVELKFPNKKKYTQWEKCLNDRIIEMKISSSNKEEQIDSEMRNIIINPKVIFFGTKFGFKEIKCNLYNDITREKMFTFNVKNLNLYQNLREYDSELKLTITSINAIDTQCDIKDFTMIATSESKYEDPTSIQSSNERDLLELTILICNEESDKYKNINIDISIRIGFLYVLWNPIVIRRLLAFLVHNQIEKDKIKREISNQNEKMIDTNFVEPGTEEVIENPICTISTYTDIKYHCEFKDLYFLFIQPKLNIMYSQIRLRNSFIECDKKVDHFTIKGQLGNTQLFDLSQYPFVINNQSEYVPKEKKEIFGVKKNTESLISFEFKSMNLWCPEMKDNFVSEANVIINSAFLVYFHEHFLRVFNYIISEFLGALSPSKKVEDYIKRKVNIKPKDDVDKDFLLMNIQIFNPQLILKPRNHMKEYFLIDLGIIALKCEYQKVFGKIREHPEQYRWLSTYQFEMKNVTITTEDNFKILSPSNGIVNMHFTLFSEKDNLLSNLQCDFSCQFDVFFEDFMINLRQRDFMNLMRCFDLNIMYTDGKGDDYLYIEQAQKDDIKQNNNDTSINVKKEDVLKKYFTIIAYFMIGKVSLTLYLENTDTHQIYPFTEMVLKGVQMIITKNLIMNKDFQIAIGKIGMYILNQNKGQVTKDNILSDFSKGIYESGKEEDILNSNDISIYSDINKGNNETETHDDIKITPKESKSLIKRIVSSISVEEVTKKIFNMIKTCKVIDHSNVINDSGTNEINIHMSIDKEKEKYYSVVLEGVKLLLRIDTFQLIKLFFIEGFPYYDKHLKDLPNAYDPNEDNNPGMELSVRINHALICLLTDEISILDQELICITSEVIIHIKEQKKAKIKNMLIKKYNEIIQRNPLDSKEIDNESENDIQYKMSANLTNICPFICNLSNLESEKDLYIGKRKIINIFNFNYNSFIQFIYIPKENSFVTIAKDTFSLTKMIVKASYRDLILYYRMYSYNVNLQDDNYIKQTESLKYNSNAKAQIDSKYKNTNTNTYSYIKSQTSINIQNKKHQNIYNSIKNKIEIKTESFQLILIDDHANTFYPFLSFVAIDFSFTSNTLNKKKSISILSVLFKVLTYNYIAGYWEPLIEKTSLSSEFTTNSSNPLQIISDVNIKTSSANKASPNININISDLMLVFLCSTLNKWYDGYNKLKTNYKEEMLKLQNQKDMTITNHTIFNYTGREMTVYKQNIIKSKKDNLIGKVRENGSFEIAYFDEIIEEANDSIMSSSKKEFYSNLQKEKIIKVKLKDVLLSNNTVRIDTIHTKKFNANYKNIIKNDNQEEYKSIQHYSYIISTITSHKLKKYISFYSPLALRNETQFPLKFKISNNIYNDLTFTLSPKKTIGIPFEYLCGFIGLIGQTTKNFFLLKLLESKKIIMEEIQYDNNTYIHFYHPPIANDETVTNKIIKIRTSYTLRNCLPFDIQVIANNSFNFKNIPKGETISLSDISIFKSLSIQLFFYTFKSNKSYVIYEFNNPKNTCSLEVVDKYNHSLEIFATLNENYKNREIILHVNSIIINHTGLNIIFKTGNDKKKMNLVANQTKNNNYFLLSGEKYIELTYQNYKSESIPINTIGSSMIIEMVNRDINKKIELVMEISLSLLAKELDIYTNIVKLVPKFILYNQLKGYNVKVILYWYIRSDELFILNEEEKRPLYITNVIKEEKVQKEDKDNSYKKSEYLLFIPIDNKNKDIIWKPSTAYNQSFGALYTLVSKAKKITRERTLTEKESILYFNIEKKIDNLSTYLVIKPCNESNALISIRNYSSNVSFKIWQEEYESYSKFINLKSKVLYYWSNMKKNQILNFQFYIGNLIQTPLQYSKSLYKFAILENEVIDLSNNRNEYRIKYPFNSIIKIKTSLFSGFKVKLNIVWEGSQMVISINDIIEDVTTVQLLKTEYRITIGRLGLSLIGDNTFINESKGKYERQELCYITFSNIKAYAGVGKIKELVNTEFQIMIEDVEIDNELSYDLINFPIILFPHNSPRRFIDKKDAEIAHRTSSPFLNFVIGMQNTPNDNKIKITRLSYLIQSFELKIESSVIIGILNFINNITLGLKTSFTKIHPLFLPSETQKQMGIEINDWKYTPIWKTSKGIDEKLSNLSISNLDCSAIDLELTFLSLSKDKIFLQLLESNKVLSSLLNAISNTEKAPIFLSGCKLNNFNGNWNELIGNIMYNYKQRMLVHVMKIVGSSDLLGNPVNLFSNLGKGFQALIQKPRDGLLEGPLQGAIGLVDGGVSFAKHTVDGTFNTTSKITSGLSKGMLFFTQDEDFINEREKKKITENPSDLVEGFAYGMFSMVNGVFSGISDIVTKPIEGAKKESVKGFSKGVLKGVGGVIIKPISGVLDLISKTTEGFKNSFKEDEKIKRIRIPRPFYGKMKLIKAYNNYDAEVIQLLKLRMSEIETNQYDFYSCEIYKDKRGDNILMIFTGNEILIIDFIRKELKASLPYSNIKNIKIEDDKKILIGFNKEINNHMSTVISFHQSEKKINKVYLKIVDAIRANTGK